MAEGERPSSPEPPAGSETGFSLMYSPVVGRTVELSHQYVHAMVLMYVSLKITVLTQIKRMIQSSARNSILEIYGWIQLSASRH